MSLKLDPRVRSIATIYSVTEGCADWPDIINKKGYFANRIADFQDLKKCAYGKFAQYREHDNCFLCEDVVDKTFGSDWYAYFLREDLLQPAEKKYRPYSLNEFLERFKIGNTVTFRLKKGEHVPEEECRVEYTRLITGYETLPENRDIPGKSSILLGGCPPTSLARLFEFYELENEYYFPTVWQPFGIIDEGKK